MSPVDCGLWDTVASFPRVSGDEPLTVTLHLTNRRFSPRERG